MSLRHSSQKGDSMKRMATIEVYAMEPGEQQGEGGVTNHDGYTKVWKIRLACEGEDAGTKHPEVLAHELGHVVAQIFHTDASTKDNLAQFFGAAVLGDRDAYMDYKEGAGIRLDAEKEAWKFAHEEGVPEGTPEEKKSLASYQEAVDDAPR